LIEAIKTVGENMLMTAGSGSFLSSLVDTAERAKNIVILDFDIAKESEPKVETWGIDSEKLDRVKWVGNVKGNKPQDRLTTDNLQYLIQSIPNLEEQLPNSSTLKKKLQQIVKKYYCEIPDLRGSEKRYANLWNLEKMMMNDPDLIQKKKRDEIEKINELINHYGFCTPSFYKAYVKYVKKGEKEKQKENVKNLMALVAEIVRGWLDKHWGVPKKDNVLFTIKIDGQLLAEDAEYHEYLEKQMVDDAFEDVKGQCYICSRSGEDITKNFTRFRLLKFYINDKMGFASNLEDKGFFKNYAVCSECYKYLLVGERFVENQLKTKLGETDVYLIPQFYQDVEPKQLMVKEWAEQLKRNVEKLNKLEALEKFQEKISDDQYNQFGDDSYLLNFLFARRPPGSAEVKVQRFVQDVPPHRITELTEALKRIRNLFEEGKLDHFALDYSRMYYLLPIRKVKNEPQIGTYLDMLESLLKGNPVKLSYLTKLLMETARVHAFNKYEAYVQTKSTKDKRLTGDLEKFLIRAQFLVYYLKQLGLLKELQGGGSELIWENLISLEIKDYWEKVGLVDHQRALFLLGYLIGEIGKKQFDEGKSKPIMNKINFQGMTESKIKVLASEVLEKLYQYKIWKYKEGLYAAMKELLDKSLGKFTSLEDNVFWILSGYAFSTAQALKGKNEETPEEREE
jgi:CRISPR-associated protein Csh1